MTLTVTLELPPDAEAQLQAAIAEHDAAQVRHILIAALDPMVEALLEQPSPSAQEDEGWDALVDQLVTTFATSITADTPILSNYATSRAGIYEEHA